MNEYPVEAWVEKAEGNYISALDLAKRRKHPVPDVICNQCQQCAEKYLKAFLVRHHTEFPKIHDLLQLEGLAQTSDSDFRLIHDKLKRLNWYSVEIRYPGTAATVDDAKEAINAMKEVRKFVRAKLGLKSR
ncbi:MAG: HEPN domain-containing protein [Chloroflexota bacterium]